MDMVASVGLHPGGIVAWVLVGLLAGAIAGRIARGHGYGWLGNIVLGLLGAFIGGATVSLFVDSDRTAGFIDTTLIALVGALVLIVTVRVVRRVF